MIKKKRHIKLTHATHVKRHTVGTSNELSFSVLEAAKAEADADASKGDKKAVPHFGGISLFTLSRFKKGLSTPTHDNVLPVSDTTKSQGGEGASGSSLPGASKSATFSYASPQDEIARRKSRRLRHKWLALVLAVVVAMALLGLGSSYLYRAYTNNEEQLVLLNEALDILKAADDPVIAMDEALNSELNEAVVKKMQTVTKSMVEVEQQLNDAEALANEASHGFRESRDKEAAIQTIAAIDARRSMIASGKQLMEASVAAYAASTELTKAWEEMLMGDQLARDAAALVTDTTPEHVAASKVKSEQAKTHFEQAILIVADAEALFPPMDLTATRAYLEKRIESMDYAMASDDAILAMNKEEAVIQNNAYNKADGEAAVEAKRLPKDPVQLVSNAYEASTEGTRESYNEARSNAATADSFIRYYLGTNGK